MKTPLSLVIVSAGLLVSSLIQPAHAAQTLWNIGQKDGSGADLAPADDLTFIDKFPQDPFFIIGKSVPAQDWPRFHPGPLDGQGIRHDARRIKSSHTFSIVFGLKAPVSGTCRLVMDLVDTDFWTPPQIIVYVNNHPLPVQIPAKGNNSKEDHPEKGHHQSLAFEFPGNDLRTDNNLISIKTDNGGLLVYDALHLETPDGATLNAPTGIILGTVTTDDTLSGPDSALMQTLHVPVCWLPESSSASTLPATLSGTRGSVQQIVLKPNQQKIDFIVPEVKQKTLVTLTLAAGSKTYTADPVEVSPMRKWIIYLLPMSHHDLGFTVIQTQVRAAQMQFIDDALDLIKGSKDYPPGERFIWNAEVLWSVDDYLTQHPEKAPQFIAAVKEGSLYPNGWYADDLTGLCRPEELLRMTDYGLKLQDKTGVPIDSAMISDVPGLSWGCVQALNEAGIRYLSDAPNYLDHNGHTMSGTEDQPFYWLSPSGHNKVLFWTSWGGYAVSWAIGKITQPQTQQKIISHLEELEEKHYPYDMIYLRWDAYGDNAAPDALLTPFVKSWNETHSYPHMIIASTSTAFHALEDKYGKDLPSRKGEFTPYWEDTAITSAHETSLNRDAAERLVQAETLFALLKPFKAPVDAFATAWKNVLLFDEHTWGSHSSYQHPDSPDVQAQWKIKQAFALDADQQSKNLLQSATSDRGATTPGQFDVFNTCGWTRTDVVTLSKSESSIGDVVKDDAGNQVPSQRLSTGELAFLAQDVPPLASKRYTVTTGPAYTGPTSLKADNLGLSNDSFTVKLDPKSGGITEWSNKDHSGNLIDPGKANLNDYVYVLGAGLEQKQSPGTPTITVKESGPLEISVVVNSTAPGAKSLSREVKIYQDLSRIDLIDNLDKNDVRDIEAGHIAFPFHLPNGQIRLDSQFAVTRPDIDQIPGANKNWFSVSRWADVSNPAGYGVTVVTQDAPLMEVGGITADLPQHPLDPNLYLTKLGPSQTLYSWIFGNHWQTNAKANQSGMLTYRYYLQTHKDYSALAASRFGVERSQPLQVFPATGTASSASRMTLEPNNLLLTAFKSSDDGQAMIVRVFNPSDAPVTAQMNWSQPQPTEIWLSDMSEKPRSKITGPLTVPAWSLMTVRAKF